MKKLSSIFVALALVCFVVLSSCQGSGKTEEAAPAATEETMEEESMEMEEVADSAAAIIEDSEATLEEEAE